MKSLGYVDGGAAAVVDALVEVFVENNSGTVLLPTFSIEGSMHRSLLSGRVFDAASTASNLGAIPEACRRHRSARRSVHPTHSFAAIGVAADWLVSQHHYCGSSFGQGSPMARLLEAEGYLLGLGTTLGSVTFYHCLEDLEAGFPLNVYSADSPIMVACRDQDGVLHHLPINAHDAVISQSRIDRPSSERLRQLFEQRLRQNAGLGWFSVGEAKVWLVGAKPLYDEAKRLMDQGVTIYSTASELAAFEHRTGDGTFDRLKG
ncbi:MAG: AAC(3) family N-acetyltransferase [Geminicoccaceae bacterium]